jgi:hypothetical protein
MSAKSKPTLLAVLLSAASVAACARSAPPADRQAPTTESSELTAPPPAKQPTLEAEPKDAPKAPSGAGAGAAPPVAPGVLPTPPKSAAKPNEQLPEKNPARSSEKKKGSAGDLDQGAGRGASGLPPSGPQEEGAHSSGLYSELIQAFDHMAQALSAPDCVSAAVFRDRVCELSERICRLADERPSAGATQHWDGRARCGDARRSFATSCPTP